MPKVGTAYVSIRAKLDKLDKDLNDAKSMTMRSANAIQKSVSNIFKSAVGFATVGAFTAFTKSIFETGKEVTRLEKAYQEITGSTAAANNEFKFLRDTSDQLGQNFYDLADSYKGLAAASKGTALEGAATRDIFVAITKASASLGLTTDSTRGALAAIQQMMSKGKVSAEELRQQLGERLPGAFNLMAEAMGVSTAQLDKMLQDGKVLAEDALPKLATVLTGRYTGAIDEATRSSNKLSESWTNFKVELGKGDFINEATKALKTLTETLNSPGLQEGLKSIIGLVGQVASGFANMVQSVGGWAAVNKGDLSFLEFATMNAQDLSKWMKENYTDAGKLQLKLKQLQKELEKESSFFAFSPDAVSDKNARMKAIRDQIKEIKKEIDAAKTQINFDPLAMPHAAPEPLELKKLKGDGLTEYEKDLKNLYETFDDLRLKVWTQEMERADELIKKQKESLQAYNDDMLERRRGGGQLDALYGGIGGSLDGGVVEELRDIKEKYKETFEGLASLSEETARAMQAGFSDLFFDAFTGELDSLSDYADAIFKSLARAMASYLGQMAVFGQGGTGGLFGTSGVFASLFHSGGKVGYDMPQSRSVNPFIFANAPRLHGGLRPDEFPAILQKGETVLPKGMGGGAVFNLQINNNAGAKVTESRTPNSSGGFDIQVAIDQAVADSLGRRGTISNKTLRNQYGAQERLISR